MPPATPPSTTPTPVVAPSVAPPSVDRDRDMVAAGPVSSRRRAWRRAVRAYTAAIGTGLLLAVLTGDSPAAASAGGRVWAGDGSKQLGDVIDNARLWVIGLLAGLATLFLVVAGVRYLTSGGDPGEVERAKTGLKSAAIGYALAILAPILMTALKSIVGG